MVLPGVIVDVHRGLTIFFGKPHHVQHSHPQTLLLSFVAYRNVDPAVQKVIPPLSQGKGKGMKKDKPLSHENPVLHCLFYYCRSAETMS